VLVTQPIWRNAVSVEREFATDSQSVQSRRHVEFLVWEAMAWGITICGVLSAASMGSAGWTHMHMRLQGRACATGAIVIEK
jgi:hypothetical protein